jgi:hypothetical protein
MITIFFELRFLLSWLYEINSNKNKDKDVNFMEIKHKIINFAVA